MIKSNTKVRIFSAVVVGYMLMALAWWALLLYQKTSTIYTLKAQNAASFPSFESEYNMQRYMILGEAIVIAGAMILGIIVLNRAFKREMVAVKQQKNFLLSVTHELKSPITAISLILDTFKRKKLDSKQTEILIENGQEEANRLSKLVEDLLTAARLNPKSTLRKETVNVEDMVYSLFQHFERNYPNCDFKIEKSGLNFLVQTNEPSLYLIVSNLLENAVKYSHGEPAVTISLRKQGSTISLAVADNGVGIPDKEKRRIFDQFYRVGEEDIRTAKGTGLGLYLVSELCNKLDIKIKVRDNDPQGSIFELLIPTK